MSARKPSALVRKHIGATARAKREAAENSMRPAQQLSTAAPVALRKHRQAAALWRRLVNLYGSTVAQIITPFDEQLLIRYVLAIEECEWIEAKRARADLGAAVLEKQLSKLKPRGEQMHEYLVLLEQINALNARAQGWHSRLDTHRKMIHDMEKSLFLSPRSRAGVAPTSKEPEKEPSDMELILDDRLDELKVREDARLAAGLDRYGNSRKPAAKTR